MKPKFYKKSRAGKKSKFYSVRYQCDWMAKPKEINLKVTEKEVAEKKFTIYVNELEREHYGFQSTRALKEAAEREIKPFLDRFIRHKVGNRSKHYIQTVRACIERICLKCNWIYLKDIRADEFEDWRADQDLHPKTLNEYLGAFSSFCQWLYKNKFVPENPFCIVDRLPTNRQEDTRRAFSLDEVKRLLKVETTLEIKTGYMLGLYCGLRRNEINTLKWFDVHLDCKKPKIVLRSVNTKNGKSASIPLIPVIADYLRQYKKVCHDQEFVTGRLPRMPRMLKDWEVAGIEYIDDRGRYANFHCLRHTLCTMLHNAGVSLRIAQAIMRHSDPKLTAMTYTDQFFLDQRSALEKLPDMFEQGGKIAKCPPICPPIFGNMGQFESLSVTLKESISDLQVVDDVKDRHDLSWSVTEVKMEPGVGVEPTTC
jgi:integrase